MADRVETSRIGSGVSPPGIDRAEGRCNLPARIGIICDFEGQDHAARVYRWCTLPTSGKATVLSYHGRGYGGSLSGGRCAKLARLFEEADQEVLHLKSLLRSDMRLADVHVPDPPLAVDEVGRRPVAVAESVPHFQIVVDHDRVGDIELTHFAAYVVEFSFSVKFGGVHADDPQSGGFEAEVKRRYPRQRAATV